MYFMIKRFDVPATLIADQHPRKFFDQRDAGLYIARWPDGKVPSNALLYTSEVTNHPSLHLSVHVCCIREPGLVWNIHLQVWLYMRV